MWRGVRAGAWSVAGAGDGAGFAFGAVLEATPVAAGAIVGPPLARVGPGRPQAQFSPFASHGAAMASVAAAPRGGQGDVAAPQRGSFFGPQAAVVQDAEERGQPRATGPLGADRLQQGMCFLRIRQQP